MLGLRGRRLFDGRNMTGDAVITIDDGVVVDVGNDPGPGVHLIDLGDVTLLPGLIDTHQHLCFNGDGTLESQVAGVSDVDLERRARANAQRALRAGITTIRDLGDRGYVTLELRDDPDLPTVLAAGPPITALGGHCWFLGGACERGADLVAAVHERHRRGCDVVKVMVTGGALTPTTPMWESQFTAADLEKMVATAHEVGLPVAAHCHGIGGIAEAVRAGVDTLEHCTFFTSDGRSEPDDALLGEIAARGVVISATLGRDPAIPPPPLVAANQPRIMAALRTHRRNGGTIVIGTDAGINAAKPHDILPHAAMDLADIGFSGLEILTTFTATAASACGIGHRKGRLAAGFDADIVAVEGDPATTPEALRHLSGVWRAGRRIV